jgi:large subunit ribosomal protein L9
MKIILNKDVVNVGEEGDVKEVAKGFARNYLIPQKLAVLYTKQNLNILKSRQALIQKKKDEKRVAALGLKEKLEADELLFRMPAGENGKLFGSVSSALIADELVKRGYTIEKKRIEVPDNHIRNTGHYIVKVKIYEKEEAHIKVKVESTTQQHEQPAQKEVKEVKEAKEPKESKE